MVQRSQAVHGVVTGQCGRRCGAEGRERPAVVGDLLGHQLSPADRVEHDVGDIAGIAGVGPVPAGQLHGVRVDLLHVDHPAVRREFEVAVLATAEDQHLHRQGFGRGQVGRVGDDLGDTTESHRLFEVGVIRHQHRDRTQSRQGRDRDQCAGPGVHQHTDPDALAHADVDQTAHDVVDAPVDGFVGVHPAVE